MYVKDGMKDKLKSSILYKVNILKAGITAYLYIR